MTITNDDAPPPSVSIAATSVDEGATGTTTPVTLTLTLSSAATAMTTVAWVTSNGTATTANADYTAANGTATFAAGQLTATISVNVIGDNTVEQNETFTVTLSNPTGGLTLGSPSSATVTITNDDVPPPSVSIAGNSVNEGATGTTTPVDADADAVVGRDGVDDRPVDDVERDGDDRQPDFTTASGTVTFIAGQTTATITVDVTGDSTFEANETFTVTLSNPTGGLTLGSPSSATVTITNDDAPADAVDLDRRSDVQRAA